MMTINMFRKMALSLPDVKEEPHFEKISFRINNKIFATYDQKSNKASLKLSLKDQDIFSLAGAAHIYLVPNKWGQQGWTFVEMKTVRKALFKDILTAAYNKVSSKNTILNNLNQSE